MKLFNAVRFKEFFLPLVNSEPFQTFPYSLCVCSSLTGADKLGYQLPIHDLVLVLEEDGSEIEEDEILLELKGQVLLLLKGEEKWSKPD